MVFLVGTPAFSVELQGCTEISVEPMPRTPFSKLPVQPNMEGWSLGMGPCRDFLSCRLLWFGVLSLGLQGMHSTSSH